jgi:hypothetical protein
MISEDEKEMLINEIVERMLLKIPDIVGNLITVYADKIRMSKEFYAKYPEFSDHRDVVASVIESMDANSKFKPFKEVVEDSVPVIRKRIELLKGIDMKTVKKPNLDFSQGEL